MSSNNNISSSSSGSADTSAAAADVMDGATPSGPKRWSRAAEDKLRKQFLHEVREKCKDEVTAWAKCAKEEGFMVVFRCREAQGVANACAKKYSSDAQYEEYKRDKKREWIRQGLLVPGPDDVVGDSAPSKN